MKLGERGRFVRFTVLIILVFEAVLGCKNESLEKLATAEVGLFYGGQMQRVQRVEVSSIRAPKIGFRVDFPLTSRGVAPSSSTVEFEIARPGPAGRRVTSKDVLTTTGGQRHLDHVFSFDRAARLGLWNIRVTHEGRVLADRALYLVSLR